ncbi:hypothetical protein ACIQUV_02515 [Streptomyces globosus]|uniref:hypothetical protein n=1 Tax=Streptomyces TaxID=1883 RepID=UPI00340E204F
MCLHGFSKPAEAERELVFTQGHDQGRTCLEAVLHHALQKTPRIALGKDVPRRR